MATSLYNQLMNNTNSQPLSSNPMINAMANSNPALAQILRDVQANGGDARALFYKRAQEQGIADPTSILQQAKQASRNPTAFLNRLMGQYGGNR